MLFFIPALPATTLSPSLTRILSNALIVLSVFSASPLTGLAQEANHYVFSIDAKFFISTRLATNLGPILNSESTHLLKDSITRIITSPMNAAEWVDSMTDYSTHMGLIDQDSVRWSLVMELDRESSHVRKMILSSNTLSPASSGFCAKMENFPIKVDGEDIIIDVPRSLLSLSTISYERDHGNGYFDYMYAIDTVHSYIHIKIGTESLLRAAPSEASLKKNDLEFQAISNVQDHSTTFRFASSRNSRTLMIYNALGRCVGEIIIAAGSTSERTNFSNLPTGHYIARLDSEARSFAVWQ